MKIVAVIALIIFHVNTWAGPMDTFVFDSDTQEKSFQKLSEDLRCLVCQNQSIADSNAELATDLRTEIYGMLKAGKTEQQIKTFMVERYGDYVLYEPPFKPMTWLLWFGPVLIFLFSLFYVRGFISRQVISNEPEELSAEEIERVKELQLSLSEQKNTDGDNTKKEEGQS